LQVREPSVERRGIWVIDFARGIPTRLTPDPSQFPVWSPDGTRVAWVQERGSVLGIHQRNANGVGDMELLVRADADAGGNTFPVDWTADGRFLLYTTRAPKTRIDTWAVPLFGDRKPHAVLASEFDDHHAQVSPDGRWIAYRTDASGSHEIYLQSFTADGHVGNERFRVSQAGGSQPRFRRDGTELFYVSADGRMTAVSLKASGASIEIGAPRALFQTRMLPVGGALAFEYDVSPDGQRFLIGTVLDGPNAAPPTPTIVLNWLADVKAAAQRGGR
jgi:Tol biopolymer transport system component